MNNFSFKKSARDHDQSRAAICGVCLRKDPGLRKITPILLERVQSLVWLDYCIQNPGLPTSICGSCRTKLQRLSKVPKFFNNPQKSRISSISWGTLSI